jgi:hypothetical protein
MLLKEWGLSDQDVLWMRHSIIKDKPTTSFTLTKSIKEPVIDQGRLNKILEFRMAQSTFYHSLQAMKLESLDLYEKGETHIWFKIWRNYPEKQKLPETHCKMFDDLFVVVAHFVLNILDDPERLRRARSISHKIPVSFLVTSLYFINP